MPEILAWTRALSLVEGALACGVVNVLLFAALLALGTAITRAWRTRPVVYPPPAVTRAEHGYAVVTVILNSGVMFVGWLLFRNGVLRVDASSSVLRWLVDAGVLTLVMDLAMYVTHRLAHVPVIYRRVHGIHHRYDQPRALTLFVLHPIEVVGFGGLWIAVLLLHSFSLGGMVLYLALNSTFGVFGHVGVEPMPHAFASWPLVGRIGTSTFHARHHQQPGTNFGFYTSFWDQLFGTLDPRYRKSFGRPPE